MNGPWGTGLGGINRWCGPVGSYCWCGPVGLTGGLGLSGLIEVGLACLAGRVGPVRVFTEDSTVRNRGNLRSGKGATHGLVKEQPACPQHRHWHVPSWAGSAWVGPS